MSLKMMGRRRQSQGVEWSVEDGDWYGDYLERGEESGER